MASSTEELLNRFNKPIKESFDLLSQTNTNNVQCRNANAYIYIYMSLGKML